MYVRPVETRIEKEELDTLLWINLWKSLGLPRDIRKSFALESPELEFITLEQDDIIGGMVVNELSGGGYEIRHIAVNPDFRNRGAGKMLVEHFIGSIKDKVPLKIQTHARNTSMGFFGKLGFLPVGDTIEHPDFTRHGILIQPMYLDIPSA